MRRPIRVLVMVFIVSIVGLGGSGVDAAQGDPVERFPLPANSAYCEPGYLGPFVGCTPWSGVTVTYSSSDGMFEDSCTTQPAVQAATCTVNVPYGATVTASIDPSVVPSGYALEGEASQTFEIPSGPPQGLFGGPSFVLLPDAGVDALVAAIIAILLAILSGTA